MKQENNLETKPVQSNGVVVVEPKQMSLFFCLLRLQFLPWYDRKINECRFRYGIYDAFAGTVVPTKMDQTR